MVDVPSGAFESMRGVTLFAEVLVDDCLDDDLLFRLVSGLEGQYDL